MITHFTKTLSSFKNFQNLKRISDYKNEDSKRETEVITVTLRM